MALPVFQFNAMRHKYFVNGLVLARFHYAEDSSSLILLTDELGLLRASVRAIRKPHAKLASSLQTLTQSDLSLVHGKLGWRLFGARQVRQWAPELSFSARQRAARVVELLIRLAPGELKQVSLYNTFIGFLKALDEFPEDLHDAIERLAALRTVHALGLDDGVLPEQDGASIYHSEVLRALQEDSRKYVMRINRGIVASGL